MLDATSGVAIIDFPVFFFFLSAPRPVAGPHAISVRDLNCEE